ncbi:unnamed protein product [Toxocara canis]|uniref:Uncharacterized protein n=1 Tax=Toxocara canis TaxID=6265 RepID=A0A183UUV1_TOXCA|nr:unnamed protein product [Toxocara canis]
MTSDGADGFGALMGADALIAQKALLSAGKNKRTRAMTGCSGWGGCETLEEFDELLRNIKGTKAGVKKPLEAALWASSCRSVRRSHPRMKTVVRVMGYSGSVFGVDHQGMHSLVTPQEVLIELDWRLMQLCRLLMLTNGPSGSYVAFIVSALFLIIDETSHILLSQKLPQFRIISELESLGCWLLARGAKIVNSTHDLVLR